MTAHAPTALCPVCSGTGRQPINPHSPQGMSSKRYDRTFAPENNTIACRNCGGQTVLGQPTGRTRLRPDGTPCIHEYKGERKGSCYVVYTCIHCGYSYDIDSGD